MILDALFASIADFALGFAFALLCFVIAVLIHNESQAARQEQVEPGIEEADIWAGLTPDRDVRAAEARFRDGRRVA